MLACMKSQRMMGGASPANRGIVSSRSVRGCACSRAIRTKKPRSTRLPFDCEVISMSDCALDEVTSKDLLQDSGDSEHSPAELATNTMACLEVGLHDQEHDSSPEDSLETVDDCVCLVASPLLELLDVFRQQLVADQDQALGSLLNLLVISMWFVLRIKTHHSERDSVCSCSWLILHEQSWYRQANCDNDQDDVDNLHRELVLGLEEVLESHCG